MQYFEQKTILEERGKKKIEAMLHQQLGEHDTSKSLLDNDRLIIEALKRVGRATRNELAKLCQLPRTTAYDAIKRLELKQLVGRYVAPRTTRGRPPVFFSLTMEATFL